MLHVDLDNILTHEELASKAEEVLRKTDEEGKIVVVTRDGRPAVAILKLEQLEELSGRPVNTAPMAMEKPSTPPPVAEMPSVAPHQEEHSGLPDMPDMP